MKQMGWTEGKGLGKNEDGMPDFIRPKKKVNTKGIGFNGVDDRWIEHQEAFDILLSNLNDGNPAAKEDKLIGVEERAYKLGGRVHYSKFLKGKDLSQKKKEDLNAIVVKRKKNDAENVQEADATGQEDLSGLKTHTSSMSYQEYFAQRMKASRRHKGLNEDGDLQSYEQTEETRGEDSEITSKKKHKRYEKDEHMQDEWTSHADEEVVGAGLALNRDDTEDAYSMYNANVQLKKKKKSKHKSYDGGDSQWSDIITEQRADRLSGDSLPEECSLEEGVPKRQRKLKHADDSEQTFHEATMSQMGFHSKYSAPDQVKKKSKYESHIGTENQWTETIISPVECSLKEDVPKRLKKSKRTVENSVENSEQALPETAASQMEFCSEHSVRRVKKKSKHEPDRDTTGQRFEANTEQWDDGNRSSWALAETLTSSTKHIVHKSEEAAPKRTKKLKRQPCPNMDDTADGSLQASTVIVPTTEFSSEEHQQQMKKSKHRPVHSTVEEEQPETRSKKEAVASLADRAAREEVSMLPLQTSFKEEMPKRVTKKPKQKAPEVADETSKLKIHTGSVEGTRAANGCFDEASSLATRQPERVLKQSGKLKKKLNHDPTDEVDEQKGQEDKVQGMNRGTAKATALATNTEVLPEDCAPRKSKRKQEERERKRSCTPQKKQKCAEPDVTAKARKESYQQQEGVVAKKRKQEPEQNEVAEEKTKKNSKQNQTGGSTPKEPNSEQERNEAKAQIKREANENPKQKLTSGKASLKREKAAPNAQTKEESISQKEGVTPKISTRKQEQTGPEVKAKKVSKQKQTEEPTSNEVITGQQNEPNGKAKNNSKQDQNYKKKLTPKISNPKQKLPEPKPETTIQSPQKQKEKIITKKSNFKQEQNELNIKTKMVPKQKHMEGVTSSETNPEEEQTKMIVKKKTIQTASKPAVKKTVQTATKLVAEKPAQTASKLVAKKSEVSKEPVQLRQNVQYNAYGRTMQPAEYNAYRRTMQPEASMRGARHPTSLPGHRGRLGYPLTHPAGSSADSRDCPYDAGKAARDFIASRKKIAIRNSRARNAARKHQRKAERPRAWRLDIIERGMWRPLFKPDVKVLPVDDDTAMTMAQWVVDTVEHSGCKVTPAKACHLDKETFAMALADHIYMQHSASNWMHIPGYGSKSWVEGCVNLLFARLLARNQNQASESFVQ